jgi:hypothetical protein
MRWRGWGFTPNAGGSYRFNPFTGKINLTERENELDDKAKAAWRKGERYGPTPDEVDYIVATRPHLEFLFKPKAAKAGGIRDESE